jgi:Fe2+ or Zn2+ uptake regulation protein
MREKQHQPMESEDTALADALHREGMRVTPQRLVIARALRRLDRHASVDEVASTVVKEFPQVSVPTVYSALELLADLGFARRVTVAPGAVLYDPHTDDHHHLVCTSCHSVTDVDVHVETDAALESARRQGFTPDRAELVVTGLCRACRAKRAG